MRNKNKMTNTSAVRDKPSGLANLGNTCFMNSALQCLATTRLLIPKLEIFGSGNDINVIVKEENGETVIAVVDPEQEVIYDKKMEESHEGSGDATAIADTSDLSNPLQITLKIGPETMTGRLRQTFRQIRKFETSKFKDENEASQNNRDSTTTNTTSYYYNSYRPDGVHDLIGKNFRRGAQHDSHELLRTLVDMMKKDQTKAFRAAIMSHYAVKRKGEDSDPEHVELVKDLDKKVKNKTFVDEVFGGELMTTQTCLTCKHIKRSHEQFLDLSLPLRVFKHVETTELKPERKSLWNDDNRNTVIMKSIEECLMYFTEAELLTGSNVVECENCHRINLAKIEAGVNPEEVFPSLVSSEKSSTQSSPGSERRNGSKLSKREEKKKKRVARTLAKRKNRGSKATSTVTNEEGTNTDPAKAAGPSMPIIEDHFEPNKVERKPEDQSKKSDGETSIQSLEDYVVIHSDSVTLSSKRKIGEVDSSEAGENCMDICETEEDEMPALIEETQISNFRSTKGISESLQNLSLSKMEEGDQMDREGCVEDIDFDLPSVADGICGSLSDDDDGAPTLDLGLPSYDKFNNFAVPKSIDGNEAEELIEKPATADEGFSEGENSMSVDNEAQRISQGPSASSSRNSLSDSNETSNSKSSSSDERQKTVESRIPKVTKCPCSREQSISRPPEFLTIHFKRFQMSSGGYPSKVNGFVNYPMILDLTPFCSRESEENNFFDEEGQVLYSLYGIVEHSGSMNWGHYVAYVKSSESDARWYHISDSSVRATSAKDAANIEAYILFYERIRGEEKTLKLSFSSPSPTPMDEPEPEKEDDFWGANKRFSVVQSNPDKNTDTDDYWDVLKPDQDYWNHNSEADQKICQENLENDPLKYNAENRDAAWDSSNQVQDHWKNDGPEELISAENSEDNELQMHSNEEKVDEGWDWGSSSKPVVVQGYWPDNRQPENLLISTENLKIRAEDLFPAENLETRPQPEDFISISAENLENNYLQSKSNADEVDDIVIEVII